MSRNGQLTTAGAMKVSTRLIAARAGFSRHSHQEHQIAWAPTGVLEVATAAATWVLPTTRALWIPAGLAHETRSAGPATTIRSLYLRPESSPVAWPGPTPILVRPLLTELIGYLEGEALAPPRRARAEAVLLDLLEPAPVYTIELRMPAGGPAAAVAAGLLAEPADPRTLEQWGHTVAASARTLARAFPAETGISFGRWRARARMRAALPLLAEGTAVERAALRVGYGSASAFVAAFHRETGLTPAAYFRAQ